MAVTLAGARVGMILLDIEGTTTPLEFVHQVLFPYARARVRGFLRQHAGTDEVRADLAGLREEHARDVEQKHDPPPWRDDLESAAAYVHLLMDCDRKSTALKSLQGRIWEAGYRSGELRGEAFADVPPALARWRREGKQIAIFSSGSVLAQRLLFSHTTVGDLTPFLRAYFDTTTGPKTDAESYRRIAAALAVRAPEILFLSDVSTELDAARLAGFQTALCVRSGEPRFATRPHPVIHTLAEV